MALMKCSAARQSLCPWSYSASTSRRFHSGRLGLSKNLYKILDVKPNVSPKDLKSAYYKLSLQYHPDVNKNADAAKKFQEISEAYEILSNEGSRRTYDSEVSGFSKPSDPGSPADIIFRQRMANRRTRTAANGAHFYTFKNEWDSARTQDFEEFQRIFRTRQAGGRTAANFNEWYKHHYGHTEWNEKTSPKASREAAENLFNQRRNDWIHYQMYQKRGRDLYFLSILSGVSFAMILLLGVIINWTESKPGGYVFHDRQTGKNVPIEQLGRVDYPK